MENNIFRRFLLLSASAACFLAIFFSCVSQRKIDKICRERCPRNDSATFVWRDSIVYRDSIFFITVDGPTQFLPSPCANLCDSLGRLKPFEIKKKENGILIDIKGRNDSLIINAKADSLQRLLDKVREEHFQYVKSQKQDEIKIPCQNERTAIDGFYKYSAWIFWVLLVGTIIGLVIRHYKDRINFLTKK